MSLIRSIVELPSNWTDLIDRKRRTVATVYTASEAEQDGKPLGVGLSNDGVYDIVVDASKITPKVLKNVVMDLNDFSKRTYQLEGGEGFVRPSVRITDLVPIYGFFNYYARNRNMSLSAGIKDFFSINDLSKENVLSLGTSDWPKDPEYRRAENLTALQNSLLISYHILLPYLGLMYLLHTL